VLISAYAQYKVSSTFNRFSGVMTVRGYTGAFVAQDILRKNGVTDVQVLQGGGTLTDHFDPKRGIVKLSTPVYGASSMRQTLWLPTKSGMSCSARRAMPSISCGPLWFL
jgi:Zn-dependent membrane protease YugP